MDRELLIQNIIKHCVERGEAPTNACINAGVGKNLISHIREGRVPSVAKISDLAAYLGVTTSDLIGDARDAAPVDEKEILSKEFMFFLQQLTPEQKEALASVIDKTKKEG